MLGFDIISAAVYLFAKNENGEWCVLCGKRSGSDPRHCGGMFDVPCGLRELGESLTENALRELDEETGIRLSPNEIKFVEKQPWGNGNNGSNFIGILDRCIEPSGWDWEHEIVQWLPIKELDRVQWAYGMGDKAAELFAKFVKSDMTINENTLRKIIRETLLEMIGERGTNMDSLYHFTDEDSLRGIVGSGTLRTSGRQFDKRNRRRFISFTRHKSNLEGFAKPRECNVRIEVDGRGLSNIKGANTYPYEYYSPSRPWNKNFHNGKDSANVMYLLARNGEFGGEGAYMHQAEESFETMDTELDISKITKSIDVLLPRNFFRRVERGGDPEVTRFESILFACSTANNRLPNLIHVYENPNDFSMQTGKAMSLDEFLNRLDAINGNMSVAVEQ